MITMIAIAVVSGAVGAVLGLLALCWLYDWATEPEHKAEHAPFFYGDSL